MRPFKIEKFFLLALFALGTIILCALTISLNQPLSVQVIGCKEVAKESPLPPLLSLPLSPISFLAPKLDLSYSGQRDGRILLNYKGERHLVSLPYKLPLLDDCFWAELQEAPFHKLEVRTFLSNAQGSKREVDCVLLAAEPLPLRTKDHFPENSPFKALAESKFLGKDLFLETYEGTIARFLEIGKEILPLREGDLLSWKDGKWCKETPTGCSALVLSLDDRNVMFEIYGLDEYARLSVSSTLLPLKKEELMSAVRIRSENQLSCMIDKQCFVLRLGDWVFKDETRWRILRKQEEKQAFLQRKLIGDLIVFDQIGMKGGIKTFAGHLVSADHSQVVPIEIVAKHKKGKQK
jgi:hypothetical protein